MTEISRRLDVVFHPTAVGAAGRAVLACPWVPGRTVREHVAAAGVDPHLEIVIRVDGVLLTAAEWDSVIPDPGQLINVDAAAGQFGGDGGSNPIQAVLSIALMIAAPAIGGALAGAFGVSGTAFTLFGQAITWSGMLGAAAMLGGNMLIGAIFKPAAPALTNASASAAQASPTYSLSGGSNSLRLYEPLPLVLGSTRVFPDYLSKPFTEYHGEDQYLYQIFCFGVGDYVLSDFRIGETPITDYSDVTITRAVNGVLPDFPGNVDTDTGGALAFSTGWITRTTGANCIRIAVDLEGTFFYANDAGGLSENSAQVAIEYRAVGSSTWLPFQPDEYAVDYSHYWSRGEWAAVAAPGWYDGETYMPGDSSQVWRQLGFDSNLSASAHVDGSAASGGGVWRWVAVGADPHPPKPYNNSSNEITLSAASQKPLRVSLSRSVAAGQYQVRVKRVSADDADSRHQSAVTWSVLRSYQADTADYTGLTVIGVKIKASGQLNGAVQRLSALATASCPVWTGSAWETQATLNPAWWYLALARGQRDGGGRLVQGAGLADSRIDIGAIKAWAAFCTANDLHCAAVLDRAMNLSEAFTLIARCGFGSPSWATGKLSVVWDAVNQSPVAAFGMPNIIAGSFEVAYINDNLPDEIVVRYADRNNDWKSGEVRVRVPGATGAPVRSQSLDLTGCTTNAMAAKHANAVAAEQSYRRRRITWEADAEGCVVMRGDVVLLSHDLTQWGYSGRLLAVSGNTITLSRSVPRSGGTDYLSLVRPDGTISTFTLSPVSAGDAITIVLPTAPSLQAGCELIDHRWMFGPTATPGKKVKIVSVQPVSAYRIRLTATDEDPACYAAWSGVFTAPAPSGSVLGVGVSVDSLVLSPRQIVESGYQINQVSVSWRARGETQSVTLRAWLDGVSLGSWQGLTVDVMTIDLAEKSGTLVVEVLPVGAYIAGQPVTSSITLSALPAPAAPATASATGGLFEVALAWSFGDSRKDVLCTEVWAAASNNRAAATRIASVPYPDAAFRHQGLAPRSGHYYWLRAMDTRRGAGGWYPDGAAAGMFAAPSADASAMLTQLQGSVGLGQLAAELAAPIVQATDPVQGALAQAHAAAESALQLLLKSDSLKRQSQRDKWILDATSTIDPATGKVTLLATAQISTDVEQAINNVVLQLGAQEGQIISATQGVANLNNEMTAAQTAITQMQGQIALTATTSYVDGSVAQALAVVDPAQIAAQGESAAVGILQALLDHDATRRQQQGQSVRLASAEFKLATQADQQQAEASARLLLAAQLMEQAAALAQESQVRADLAASVAQQITTLTAAYQSGTAANLALVQQEAATRAAAVAATAETIAQVQARLNTGDYAAVKQLATTTASALGLVQAEWGVQVQTMQDGRRALAGIKLLAGTDGESVFAVLADRLLIYKPDGAGAPKQIVTLGEVNGATALGLDGNLLIDGSVVARSLSVDHLSAISASLGTVTAGRAQNSANTNFVDFDAVDGAPFIKVGSDVLINANGSGVFSRVILSAPNVVFSRTFDGISLAPNQWARIYIEAVWTYSAALSAIGYPNYFIGDSGKIAAGGRYLMESRIVEGAGFGAHATNWPNGDADGALFLFAGDSGRSRIVNGGIYVDVRFVPVAGYAADVTITNFHIDVLRT